VNKLVDWLKVLAGLVLSTTVGCERPASTAPGTAPQLSVGTPIKHQDQDFARTMRAALRAIPDSEFVQRMVAGDSVVLEPIS
jgi:hypothetical protein